jgi:hypothetical protein
MKSAAFLVTALIGVLPAAQQAAAQAQQPQREPPTPVHVTIPPGGLTFNFTDIDRNRDNNISVEEWNAFVASLQSRVGGKEAGSAAAGATGSPRQPQQPPR